MLLEGWEDCRLSSLKYLRLSDNLFEEQIPEVLGQLSELLVLDLRSNSFRDVVTKAHFARMSKLESLLLASNPLVINISSNFTPPFQLKNIQLQNTVIGPLLPAWLKNQVMFSTIDLSNGSISNIIPGWFWGLSSRANFINLSDNQIIGCIPGSFRFRNVSLIDLRNNKFHGPLPHFDDGLKYLHLSGNYFSGELLPIVNSSFLTLMSILLSGNRISGIIPPSICMMINIAILDLSSNLLSGKIPLCPEGLVQLKAMNLANNNLSGNIPHWLGSLVLLKSLHLNNNSLHGELPNLENCTQLTILDIGENKVTGKIPTWIGTRLMSLQVLRLRSNLLDGGIPHQLSLLSELQMLDLADNYLSGTLPRWFANLSAMLRLENRWKYDVRQMVEPHISPGAVLVYPYIKYYFTFEDNILVASKGRELVYRKIIFLVTGLDLSGNNFCGEIPEELTKLSDLQNLNLSRNRLSGRIPEHIGSLRHLESLDLSCNQLSGEIPSSISSLAYTSYLNMSYNKLSGKVPSGNQLQTLLDPSIYIGNRDLCGSPLPKKCQDGEFYRVSKFLAPTLQEERMWVFLGGSMGFAVGFWIFWGTLLLRASWWKSYFEFVDRMTSW